MKPITFKGVSMWVEYDYTPPEPEVRYYADGSGHPGSQEYVDITYIEIGGQDVTFLLDYYYDEIEEIIMKDHS